MFRFSELEGNPYDYYFRFPHSIVSNGIWAALPNAAKAVLPVICCHANTQGVAYPSEERIAGMSGLTPKTVRAGVKALEDLLPGFSTLNYVTRRGKRAKSYQFTKLPTDGKKYFAFYRRWIDAGNWYTLHTTPSAWAVYPVLRHFAYAPDHEDIVGDDEDDFRSDYQRREYDFYDAEASVIQEYAGITRNSLQPALRALQEANFIDKVYDDEEWRVYRWSTWFFKRHYLNSDLQSRGM